jgi:predicted nucleotidyltransferase
MSASKLFGRAQGGLIDLFYTNINESFYLQELIDTIDMGSGSTQRAVQELIDKKLVVREKRMGRYFYGANKENDDFVEVRSLATKESLRRLPVVLGSALRPLNPKIRTAFVFGSVARREAGPESDVDLMIVGDVTHHDVVPRLKKIERRLDRQVNPIIMSEADFRAEWTKGNHFLNSVLAGQKILVRGTVNDLENLGR